MVTAVPYRGASMAGIRLLASLSLVLGLLSVWADTAGSTGNTFRTIPVPNNNFQSGTVDVGGLIAGSTPTTFPAETVFTWGTSGAGADCANILTGIDTTAQAMAPGHYCIAKITLRNDNANSLDAWMRLRLVRRTPGGTAPEDALSNRLRFYMSEYTKGTTRTASDYQAADCTVQNFKPVPPVAETARSTAPIINISDSSAGNRTALTALGEAGKNIGMHPGISSPADPDVDALSGTGLGLTGGTNAVPTDATMQTNPAVLGATGYNAFNLVGNDEVTNSRRITNSNTPNGTRPGGTLPESELLKTSARYYCAALFFPSDSDVSTGNGAGDNAAAAGNVTYHLSLAASQKAGRSVN